MDNLKVVLTRFVGGPNRAIYSYDPVDPVQLIKVENDHADYPKLIDLLYNMDGHLIRDEAGRTLKYDVLGRLTSVSNSSGGASRSIHYDPLDKTAAMNDGSGQEQRFYQGDQLANQVKGADSSTFMRGDDVVLAEHQAGAGPKSLLLASDHKNTVLSEVGKAGRQDVVYNAYGHRDEAASVSSLLAYNGERREGGTGWYLLGSGYRAYNPGLMRFHSPDDWSPFGDGGFNAYCYCDGEPIMNSDPGGHMFKPVRPRSPGAPKPPSAFRAKIQKQQREMKEFMQKNPIDAKGNASKQSNVQKKTTSSTGSAPEYDAPTRGVSQAVGATASDDARAIESYFFWFEKSDFKNSPIYSQPVSASEQVPGVVRRFDSVAPVRSGPARTINPNAEEISRLEVKLEAARNVKRDYLLDQKKIDKLETKIARLRIS